LFLLPYDRLCRHKRQLADFSEGPYAPVFSACLETGGFVLTRP
jgi:hypothetical protein